jgi:hypothetical protein
MALTGDALAHAPHMRPELQGLAALGGLLLGLALI